MKFVAITYAGQKITIKNVNSREKALEILAQGGVHEDWVHSLEEVEEDK